MPTATVTKNEVPKLELVKPGDDAHLNVFLYGPPKVGKTMGAASAPKPLLFLNGDRKNATRMAHRTYDFDEAEIKGLETLIAGTLAAKSGKYATVVVDPVADLYRIVLEDLSKRALSPSLPTYGDVGTHVERFFRKLCDLPVNTVFVAHEQRVEGMDEDRIEKLPFVSTKSGSPVFAAKLMAMVDVIGYVGVHVEEDGTEHHLAQLRDGKGRRGGDRFGALGTSRELNLEEWVAVSAEASGKQKKKERSSA